MSKILNKNIASSNGYDISQAYNQYHSTSLSRKRDTMEVPALKYVYDFELECRRQKLGGGDKREERGRTIGTRTSFRSQCFSLETSSSHLCVPLFTVRGTIRVIGPCLTPRLRHRAFSLPLVYVYTRRRKANKWPAIRKRNTCNNFIPGNSY